ncbi:signal peptide peptidase SppA [Alloprevotella tannerae]|uniref:signal peptide peptidase SppA n=1 Tax=Alloprevotella tannerae TaxID=76122 RepID=UPI001EDC7866|nr:signal peptide peptidase SppA [Alloprevotella tannerae]MCG2651805.1 signal peptide peptidase SppA [Alloprevotella tannerae]
MKDFFKYTLATMLGIFIMSTFTMVMGLVMLFVVSLSDSMKPTIARHSVLKITLSGTISERSAGANPLTSILGNPMADEQGLDDILSAIRVAKDNKRIEGIYLDGGVVSTDVASLQEIRKALIDFKKSGKFIVSYADSYSQGSYYVCSVADKVLLNPVGMLDWHGLSSNPIFYKDLLEKVGVKMQVFRVGTYKSFVEPYTRTEMSPENREQTAFLLGGLWKDLCTEVAQSRRLPVEAINNYANQYQNFADPSVYINEKLVDKLVYIEEVRNVLRDMVGGNRVSMVDPFTLSLLETEKGRKNKVAVYYAYGDIVDAATSSGGLRGDEIVGNQVIQDLDELANDDNIKAVVLRVNSGGGSAYASEQIWHAVELLKKKKPVVVSMGGTAASGGYYISCGADKIIADPTTVTGSIGIFGMIPDFSGLMTEKLGLHFDIVKTNEASDFGAMGRGMTAAEGEALQNYVNRGYGLFLKRVANGRNKTVEQINQVAQGRVWTGRQALKLGLVDQLGTLEDAIKEAARLAKLDKYDVRRVPYITDWLTDYLQRQQDDYMDRKLRRSLGVYYDPLRFVSSLQGRDCLQARMYSALNIR